MFYVRSARFADGAEMPSPASWASRANIGSDARTTNAVTMNPHASCQRSVCVLPETSIVAWMVPEASVTPTAFINCCAVPWNDVAAARRGLVTSAKARAPIVAKLSERPSPPSSSNRKIAPAGQACDIVEQTSSTAANTTLPAHRRSGP